MEGFDWARLQPLLHDADVIVFVRDCEGRYLYANRAFERLVGRPAAEIVGRSIEDVLPPESAGPVRASDREAIDARRAVLFDLAAPYGSGRRSFMAIKFPLLDGAGMPCAVVGFGADLTERRHREEALQAAALAVSSARGDLFQELTRYLATILDVRMALVGRLTGKTPPTIRTLGIFGAGAYRENIEYPLHITPCADVVGKGFTVVPQGVRECFPQDEFLPRDAVAYAGYPLDDVNGRTVGVIAVLSAQPIADPQLFESVLKIFAVRAAAELERRSQEEALAASEANYRAIFEAAEDAIFIHDFDTGAVLDVNPKACSAYGYTRDELKRLSVGQISANVPPYTEADAQRLMAEVRAGGGPLRFEWRRRNRDGTLHWDEVTLKKVEIAGRPRILAMTREITERKAAEEALRDSEAQYRAIFDASADALVLWDSDLRRVDVNAAYERVFGFTPEEVLAPGYDETVRPVGYAQSRREIVLRTLAGESCQVELESLRKDGSPIQIEVRTIPIQHRGRPHVLAISRDVTERKRAEAAIRASEERYRLLFEMESDAILLVDAETLQLIDMNPVAERLWGYGREELLAMRATDISAEPDATRASVQQPSGALTIPVRWHRRKDGTVFPIEITANRFVLNGRKTILAAIRDITERLRAEAAVRASEEQYRAIFNASVDGMLLWDADHRVVDVNDAFLRMHGYEREEMLGQQHPIFIPPALRAQCAALLPQVLAGEPCRLEARSLRKDGAEFDVEIHGVPMQYRGRPHVLILLRDVTSRRQAEERLRASEERHRLLFEMESDAIVLVDVETLQHIDVNRAAVELYGYSRAELLELKSTDLSAEPEDTSAAMREGAAQAKGFVRVPLRWHRKKDGRVFPVEITANFFDLHGRRLMIAAIRDITDRKAAEEARGQLEAQLRQAQKMEAIGQLTGGIAHDFNNILQSILGNLTLALERVAEIEDARLARYLDRAQLSAQRARELIQQMLTFSRGRRGEPRLLSLAPLVAQAVKLLRPTLPASVEVDLVLDEEAPPVEVDRVLTEQVLLNLCINARDAMHGEGSLAIAVRRLAEKGGVCASCRQRFSGRYVELLVRDSGPGISAEVAERMFEPFFSTKEVGKGSGMGLAMVHGIVHEHGGHIMVDTAPGRGAAFRALFPAHEARPQSGEERHRAMPKVARRLSGAVLVVDDEPMIREFLDDLLSGWGLEVTLKENGLEAKHAFAAEPQRYDLVLTDYTMPRATGLELARQIRGIRPDVPVILCTGYSEDIAEAELGAAGVRTLVRKPVEPAELFALLKTHLKQMRNAVK